MIALGLVAEGGTWWLVARRRVDVWRSMPPVLGALGVAVLILEPPPLSGAVSVLRSAAVGFLVGLGLYLATRAFVLVAVRIWPAFERHATGIYEHRGSLRAEVALVVAVLVSVAGEELFWRGYVQRKIGSAVRFPFGRILSWAVYVAANLPSRNLAILAGAAVGGAVWVGLAGWSHGVLASLVCHATWTALMVALPAVPVGRST